MTRMLSMLSAELETAMILTGCVDIREAGSEILDLPGG
ncbi:MAG: hypothetical protein JSR86_21500 [Proteobacteria bacterium]|nr:hypothetical protein [Pseudomonadota bacterium]